MSLSFILLVGAGLLLKSLQGMREADLGFSTRGVLVSYVDMISVGYDGLRIRNFQDQFISRVQGLSGVESVVWSRTVPFTYRSYAETPIAVDGFVTEPGEQPTVEYNEVGPAFAEPAQCLLTIRGLGDFRLRPIEKPTEAGADDRVIIDNQQLHDEVSATA